MKIVSDILKPLENATEICAMISSISKFCQIHMTKKKHLLYCYCQSFSKTMRLETHTRVVTYERISVKGEGVQGRMLGC